MCWDSVHQLAVTKFSMGSEVAFTFHWKGANRPDFQLETWQGSIKDKKTAMLGSPRPSKKSRLKPEVLSGWGSQSQVNKPTWFRTRSTYEGQQVLIMLFILHLTWGVKNSFDVKNRSTTVEMTSWGTEGFVWGLSCLLLHSILGQKWLTSVTNVQAVTDYYPGEDCLFFTAWLWWWQSGLFLPVLLHVQIL